MDMDCRRKKKYKLRTSSELHEVITDPQLFSASRLTRDFSLSYAFMVRDILNYFTDGLAIGIQSPSSLQRKK